MSKRHAVLKYFLKSLINVEFIFQPLKNILNSIELFFLIYRELNYLLAMHSKLKSKLFTY